MIEEGALTDCERNNANKLEKMLLNAKNRTFIEELAKQVKENPLKFPVRTSKFMDRVLEEYDIAWNKKLIIRKNQLHKPEYHPKWDAPFEINMDEVLKKASQTKIQRYFDTAVNFTNASKREWAKDWKMLKERFELSR